MPRRFIGIFSRLSFHIFLIPLIYSTIASSITIESIGEYWFVIVAGFAVILISYIVTTILGYCFVPMINPQEFQALRIAACFPNIVAMPILIFPSLCEFSVVQKGYSTNLLSLSSSTDIMNSEISPISLEEECAARSNTMIFCYFLSWSIAFFSFGNRALIGKAGGEKNDNQQKLQHRNDEDEETNSHQNVMYHDNPVEITNMELSPQNKSSKSDGKDEMVASHDTSNKARHGDDIFCNKNIEKSENADKLSRFIKSITVITKETITSPGFVAMGLGIVTACIPPLQRALFEAEGVLRFLGSAVEMLGIAGAPISTIVAAAALVPPRKQEDEEAEGSNVNVNCFCFWRRVEGNEENTNNTNPIIIDPNHGPYHYRQRLRSFRQSFLLRSSSIRLRNAIPRSTPEMRKLHIWFCLSRLLVTPAVVVGLIVAMDSCGFDILGPVPNLAKLVRKKCLGHVSHPSSRTNLCS